MVNAYNFSNIFISYSRKDVKLAKKIGEVLLERGYQIWADWDDIPKSVDWWDEIKAGIESANIFAFIISPDSVVSEICWDEIQHAVDNNKRIVPIMYRTLEDQYQKTLHPAIRSHNWLMFQDNDNIAFEASLQQLINVFLMDVDHLRAHTKYLVRAKEWLRRGKEESFLLYGTDALEAEGWLEHATDKSPSPTDLHIQYIEACKQLRIEDEYKQQQQDIMLFVERRAIPTFLISGGSAATFIFMTSRNKDELDLLNRLTIALGGLLINGLFMAAIGLFVDDLVQIRFREQRFLRFIVATIYSLMFGSAISGVTQLVNYGPIGFSWPSIFIMGFFFGIGFSLRSLFNFNVWVTAIIVCLSIQIGVAITLGIGEQETAYHIDALRPVFHYDKLRDYFVLGFPMAFLQAVGVYALVMWSDVKRVLMRFTSS